MISSRFDTSRTLRPTDPDTLALLATPIRLPTRDAKVLSVPERTTLSTLLAETPSGLLALRYTDPGLYPTRERLYPTPWTRRDREVDHARAWGSFSSTKPAES